MRRIDCSVSGPKFRFGAEGFVVDFKSNGVHIRRDEPEGCVLVVETNPMSLASVVYGGRPVRDAEASGELALPQTGAGWIAFTASSVVYGFAMIAFFIAVSMIGPVRTSLLSYADAVISAGLGVAVLGQALTLVQVTGIALVIVALVGATLR